MKKFKLFVILSIIVLGTSCSKDQETIDEENIMEIESYITDNNLNAQRTASDLFYVVTRQGDGQSPTENSTVVTVDYRGYFPSGQQFDSSYGRGVASMFRLDQVIAGWTEGIKLFSRGGAGMLLIPSKLGYGDNPPAGIPKNAVLIFDIELHDF